MPWLDLGPSRERLFIFFQRVVLLCLFESLLYLVMCERQTGARHVLLTLLNSVVYKAMVISTKPTMAIASTAVSGMRSLGRPVRLVCQIAVPSISKLRKLKIMDS